MKTLEIVVSGRVQGVSYRFFTKGKADQFNIKGSVRNQSDGSVKVSATGNCDDLDLFMNELRIGPTFSQIREIIFFEVPVKEYENFRILY